MRKATVVAAGLMLVTTAAWSQGSMSRDEDGPLARRDDYRGGLDRRDRRPDWDRRDGSDRDEDGLTGRSAFRIRVGDTRLAVRCGEGESLRACVDAAITLLDKVRSQGGQSSSTGSGSSSH